MWLSRVIWYVCNVCCYLLMLGKVLLTFFYCGAGSLKYSDNLRNWSHLIGIKLHLKVFSGNTSYHPDNREVSTPPRLAPVPRHASWVPWILDVLFPCRQEPHSREAYRKWWWGNKRAGWVKGTFMTFNERSAHPPISARVLGACGGVVNDTFWVKLGVIGVDTLYPTLLLGCFWG